MKKPIQKLGLGQPATYQIKVQGRLDESWSAWFEGMMITTESRIDAPATTTLTGVVTDQAALHGLLTKIRDLGLPLLLVCCLELKVRAADHLEGAVGASSARP